MNVGGEVRRDVLRVAEQLLEGEGAYVVERVLSARVGGPPQHLLHRLLGQPHRLEPLVLLKHGLLGRLEHTVEAPQHDDG